eukprot:19873-Heterococcus_DN1.PRE.2
MQRRHISRASTHTTYQTKEHIVGKYRSSLRTCSATINRKFCVAVSHHTACTKKAFCVVNVYTRWGQMFVHCHTYAAR